MGASGWHYVAPYHGSVAGSLRELQERVFRERDYYWWDEFGDWEPVPESLQELWERESGRSSGTHSILDMREGIGIGPVEYPDYQVRALDPAEVKALFGRALPSRADFEALAHDDDDPRSNEFWGAVPMRWTGLYVFLSDGGTPSEVGFWGFSGD